MAGHSKWSNIKHKKERGDAKRAQAFTKVSRQIIVAAREGGPDPEHNFRLRLAVDKARQVNMPMENIQRAIRKGSGEDQDGSNFEELVYEGYGPGGVAIFLEALTDNKNRTAADLRHIFSKHGGNLGEAGCVAWMFNQKGRLVLASEQGGDSSDIDQFMFDAIDAGAEDVDVDEDSPEVITSPQDFEEIRQQLEGRGYTFSDAGVTRLPQSTIHVAGDDVKQLLRLVDALEDHDDVQEVYANFELSDADWAALEA